MNLTIPAAVLVRLLGLFFIVEGVASAFSAFVYSTLFSLDETTYSGISTWAHPASRFTWAGVALLVGVCLFFSPRALAARISTEAPPE